MDSSSSLRGSESIHMEESGAWWEEAGRREHKRRCEAETGEGRVLGQRLKWRLGTEGRRDGKGSLAAAAGWRTRDGRRMRQQPGTMGAGTLISLRTSSGSEELNVELDKKNSGGNKLSALNDPKSLNYYPVGRLI
jgi:hypothetical protein